MRGLKSALKKKPSADYDLVRWVLGNFDPEQRKQVDAAIEQTPDAA